MAIIITEDCINCDACVAECPNNAIYEPDQEWAYSDETSLTGMVTLSKDMSKIIDKQDYAKVQESFETAMGKVEEQNIQMESFLDSTEVNFSNIAADPSNVSDDEINKLIDFEAKEDIKGKDQEIDTKIEEIEKLLSDL